MALVRQKDVWDPFDILTDLQEEMNRVFSRSLSRRGGDGWLRRFQPAIELTETKDHYELQVDLPGMKKDDFEISIQGNTLFLRGERRESQEKKEKGYEYSERVYGSFSRTIDFPTEIQADKVEANYENGVLHIKVPKAESAKPKQIQVHVK